MRPAALLDGLEGAFAGSTQKLMEYWTRGKGAAKIRWGTDGDFKRCTRYLRKYFPKNPEGLCNHLHTRALGKPPGKGHAGETEAFHVDDDIEDTWDAEEAAMVPTVHTWSGLLAPIDKPTGDRRRFATALRHRDLPMPLMMQVETDEGHKKSVSSRAAGRILGVEARDGDQGYGMYGHGDFMDPALFPAAGQAIAQLKARVIGPSVDLDDITYEYRNPDGTPFDEAAAMEAMQRGEEPVRPEFVITDGRISAATLVNIPAFAEVRLELGTAPDEDGVMAALMASLHQQCEECEEQRAILASAAPTAPPAAAFADPGLTGPTPFTITDDGRVYGHVATWETCHVGFPGSCVAPPRSAHDYAYFHTGAIRTAEGDTLGVGRVVVATKHAPLKASVQAASQHYDETGAVGAYVRAGEDQFGIWVAGVLADDLTPQQLATLRANPLSGDWRGVGGTLEMVAALSVPVPGFPIARAAQPTYGAEPEPFALVAAGALAPAPAHAPAHAGGTVVDVEQIAATVRAQLRVEHEASAILGELEEERRAALAARRDALLVGVGDRKE
jgi:hypothetical protein